MSSFISRFRPWVLALVAIAAIELAVYVAVRPNEFDRTNLLQFALAGRETPQRLFVFEKVKAFADSGPTIVQSGDSSGFYGIEPKVVMRHLPPGISYLNMSCCANLGYRGYYYLLQLMAERNKSVRYIVLHITPYTLPRPELWDGDGAALWGIPDVKVFGDAIYREFLSVWRFFYIPSLALRREVTGLVYGAFGLFADSKRPLLDNEAYKKFHATFKDTLGWAPESDVRVSVPPSGCEAGSASFFDLRSLSRKTYLQDVLETYAQLARRLKVTLVVVFQPVACKTGKKSRIAIDVIDRFKRDYPEVEIPFPLIETWPSDLFSVPAHIKREHTELLGNRLGEAMAEILARRGL